MIIDVAQAFIKPTIEGRHTPITKPLKQQEEPKTVQPDDVKDIIKHPDGKGLFVDTAL